MVNRDYVLDRLRSRTVRIDEFNFDRLIAPPILSMLTPSDISDLDYIATSLKYSAKPRVKYQEIDYIMRCRGFEKFIAGTNRVAYRCLENDSILVKIAYDDVGRSDSVREFQNQMIFKPFVTKIFEVVPSGTLGIVERCIPITSREEFLAVAEDIFEVINTWFTGEYVLEDIGTNFFQNWSIRKGFGPVLHDFPYVYRLDGKKLFCNRLDPISPTGRCEGAIDYDAGFNFLRCTKCGALYRGKELELAIKDNNVIVKSEGETKMKLTITGGTKDANYEVVAGEYANMAKKIPTSRVSTNPKPINQQPQGRREEKVVKVSKPVEVSESSKALDVAIKTIEEAEKLITPDAVTESRTAVISPFASMTGGTEKEKPAIDNFEYCLKRALDVFEKASAEDQAKMFDMIKEGFKDPIKAAIDEAVTESKVSESEKVENTSDMFKFYDSLSRIVETNNTAGITDYWDLAAGLMSNPDYYPFIRSVIRAAFEQNIVTFLSYNHAHYYNDQTKSFDIIIKWFIVDAIKIGQVKPEDMSPESVQNCSVYGYDPFNENINSLLISVPTEDLIQNGYIHADGIKEVSDSDIGEKFEQLDHYTGCNFVGASIINVTDLFPDQDSSKVIVIKNNDGSYFNINGAIFAIDSINDKEVDSLSIVSANWLKGFMKRYEEEISKDEEEEGVQKVDTDSGLDKVDREPIGTNLGSLIPTGVIYPEADDDEDTEQKNKAANQFVQSVKENTKIPQITIPKTEMPLMVGVNGVIEKG